MSTSTERVEVRLYPRKEFESGLYGFWSPSGWVIEPQFKYAHDFNRGFAAVQIIDDTPALCDLAGHIIPIKSLCGWRTLAKEDFSLVSFGEDYGSINFAPVKSVGWWKNRWGLLDTNLNYHHLPERVFAGAQTIRIFGNYAMPVFKGREVGDSTVGLYNLTEKRLELPIAYSWVYPSDGTTWVVARRTKGQPSSLENRFSFFDLKRKTFLPGTFWKAHPFSTGVGAIGNSTGGDHFVDEKLERLFDRDFDSVEPFRHGLAGFFHQKEAGYLDTIGQTRLLLSHYEELGCFNRLGHAIANRNSTDWDLEVIDRQGQAQVAGIDAINFTDGDFPYYSVTKDGEEWLYDESLVKLFLQSLD
jgi:hypothetical protein